MLRLAVDNGTAPTADSPRAGLLKKVHVARKALGIADDDYRAMLARVTGHRSAKDCDGRQLGAVVAELERLGFRSARPSRRAAEGGAVARKARAMWISLHQLGAIGDPSERALEAFGRRQLGGDRLRWANEREGFRLIEALKAIADRHGWDQRVPSRLPVAERVRMLKDRLVGAQLARLAEAGQPATGPIAAGRAGWPDKRLERASAELAVRIRDLTPSLHSQATPKEPYP